MRWVLFELFTKNQLFSDVTTFWHMPFVEICFFLCKNTSKENVAIETRLNIMT